MIELSAFGDTTFQGTAGTPIREDQFIIHVGVSGVSFPSTFSWTSKEGGDKTSEAVFTRPGGLMPGLQMGGPGSRSDCTVKRQYSTALDPWVKPLGDACGNARMYVSWTPIDANQHPNGDTHTLTGVLKEIQTPATDADTAAAGFLTLVMSCDEDEHSTGNS